MNGCDRPSKQSQTYSITTYSASLNSHTCTHGRVYTSTQTGQIPNVLLLINLRQAACYDLKNEQPKRKGCIIFSLINTLWLFSIFLQHCCQVSGSGAGMAKQKQLERNMLVTHSVLRRKVHLLCCFL